MLTSSSCAHGQPGGGLARLTRFEEGLCAEKRQSTAVHSTMPVWSESCRFGWRGRATGGCHARCGSSGDSVHPHSTPTWLHAMLILEPFPWRAPLLLRAARATRCQQRREKPQHNLFFPHLDSGSSRVAKVAISQEFKSPVGDFWGLNRLMASKMTIMVKYC